MLMQLVVNGIVVGSIIAMGAIGLTMVYGILNFANFSHADFMALGSYIAFLQLGNNHQLPGYSRIVFLLLLLRVNCASCYLPSPSSSFLPNNPCGLYIIKTTSSKPIIIIRNEAI
ncbi:MAG: hypothetical protein C5S46_05660 [Candidatus Methanomarinus sp.]|uniref:Uncharacterized protein n=1 Tax=Candidatus Methanomarinus sp. TaxID=3386244 RepID=A0AC61SA92_9EURY|nr:MAG: hypothetical protein C5S46_05660 [ANME-2 cluster archaeon]